MLVKNLLRKMLLEQEQNQPPKKTKMDHFKDNFLDDKKYKKADDIGISNPETIDSPEGPVMKKRKKISEPYLVQIIKNDPTSLVSNPEAKTLDEVKKPGDYVQWMLKQYFKLIPDDFTGKKDVRFADIKEKVRLYFEDLYKTKEDLEMYDKLKRKKNEIPQDKKDINKIESFEELYDIIEAVRRAQGDNSDVPKVEFDELPAEILEKRKKYNAKWVYEDSKWEVLIPQTPETSYHLAHDVTRWCTAQSLTSNYHNYYSKDGPLFMIRDKKTIVGPNVETAPGEPKPTYQFHFESNQFMDVGDRQIDIPKFLNEPENVGLKAFFKPMFERDLSKSRFDVNDQKFKRYVNLYGANQDLIKLVLRVLKENLTALGEKGNYAISDGSEWQGYIGALGYDQFIQQCFEHAPRTVNIFDITFKNYTGKPIDVPERLGALTEIKSLILCGFIKSLPRNISQLVNLELVALNNNPALNTLPDSMGSIQTLNILNIDGLDITLPPSLVAREESGDLLLIQG